jgi:hypothetical protein
MGFQENISGVGTSEAPAWTVHNDNSVWIVWKGSGTDTTIWFTSAPSLQPNSSGVYGFSGQNPVKTSSGSTFATSTGPAIASLNGTFYLFYKGAADDYIYWATSNDGATWADHHKLALGNSAHSQDNNQNPETSAAPAVVSANDCLYLFWKGKNDNAIYWTVTSDKQNPGLWAFQQKITAPGGTPETGDSPAIALAGQTIHLVWKGPSDDNIYWSTYSTPVNPDSNNLDLATSGPWSKQQQILSGSAHSPAIVCDGNGVAWLAYTGSNGGVSFAGLQNGQWSPVYNRLGIGSSKGPALISTGKDNASIMMAWKGISNDAGIYYGSMIGPQVGTPTGPAPGTTLGGNLNYIMANLSGSNGSALTGVKVVIDVTEDIESDIGIGFQLNAYSNAGALSAWQQYFIWQSVVSSTEVQIMGQVEPWPQSTAGTGKETSKYDLLNHSYVLATLGTTKIPKGYQFTITLGTSANKVSSAQFRVVDNNGRVLYDQPAIPLVGLSLDDGTTTTVDATSSDLAEIIAFQLDVVGPINSEHAKMSSGSGTITYYVDGTMSANQNLPANTDSYWYTLEQTNSVYSTLPQGTSGSFVQTFKASN